MYTMPPDVRAISFDIWKTLLNANSSYSWPRLELVFGYVGILGYGQEAITAAYKRAEKHFNQISERTRRDTGMSERLEFMFRELGITDTAVPDKQTIIELQRQSGILRLRPAYLPALTEPDLLTTLRALKSGGYKLGTLSNTGMGDCHAVKPILKHYGLDELLDVMLFSCEDGRAKPSQGLFQRMAAEFGEAPVDVLHVGDNAHADYQATDAGLQAVLYAPQGTPEGWVGHFITSMKQLLE